MRRGVGRYSMLVGGWGQDCGAVQATHLKPVPPILDLRLNMRLGRIIVPNTKQKSPKIRPTTIQKSLRYLETNPPALHSKERRALVFNFVIVEQSPSISNLTTLGTSTISDWWRSILTRFQLKLDIPLGFHLRSRMNV